MIGEGESVIPADVVQSKPLNPVDAAPIVAPAPEPTVSSKANATPSGQQEQAIPVSGPQPDTNAASQSQTIDEAGTGNTQPASADSPTAPTSNATQPLTEQRPNASPQEETEISEELFGDVNKMIDIIVRENKIVNIDDPDNLKEELEKRNDLSPALKKALQIRAEIAKTHRAIATAKTSPQGPVVPGEAPKTPGQIEAGYQKDKGLYRVDKDGNPITSEVIYLNQTFDIFVRELGKIGENNPEAKKLGEKLASQLTRSINRPDIYIFDTSPNKELKRKNDLNHTAVDVVLLSIGDQIQAAGGGALQQIEQAVKEKKISRDSGIGRIANLLVWYNQAEDNPYQQKLLSGLIYEELRHLDARKLNESAKKNPQQKETVDRVLSYRSDSPTKNSELEKTQKMFDGYLREFDNEMIRMVAGAYQNETLGLQVSRTLSKNRGHMIPMLLCAHAVEGSDFITRNAEGRLAIKDQYLTQFNQTLDMLGFGPDEHQIIIQLASNPNVPLAILKEALGVDGTMLNDKNGMENQVHEASKIMVGRLKTDSEPLITGIDPAQDIEELLKQGRGKEIEDMIRFNMGPGMHIDQKKLREFLKKGIGTGTIGLLMLWSQIMDVLNTDENKLTGQKQGPH